MCKQCPYFDTVITEFYGKAHCGLYYKKISEEHYKEFCQSYRFLECTHFINLCEKAFEDDEDILAN